MLARSTGLVFHSRLLQTGNVGLFWLHVAPLHEATHAGRLKTHERVASCYRQDTTPSASTISWSLRDLPRLRYFSHKGKRISNRPLGFYLYFCVQSLRTYVLWDIQWSYFPRVLNVNFSQSLCFISFSAFRLIKGLIQFCDIYAIFQFISSTKCGQISTEFVRINFVQ